MPVSFGGSGETLVWRKFDRRVFAWFRPSAGQHQFGLGEKGASKVLRTSALRAGQILIGSCFDTQDWTEEIETYARWAVCLWRFRTSSSKAILDLERCTVLLSPFKVRDAGEMVLIDPS